MFTVSVKQKNPRYSFDLKTTLKKLTEKKVVAGFPKGKLNTPHYQYKNGRGKAQNKNPPSIIDVAIQNNFGIGVPRREFMSVAAKKWQKMFVESYDQIQNALEQGHIDADKFLKTMGLAGANYISETIRDWTIPPNSPETIARKGANNPLVDTGDMKNAPQYEIRKADTK